MHAEETAAILLILLCLAAALAGQASRLGLTVDEPGHIVSAHLYWAGADTLLPGDMPPLIQIVGGWPSLFFHLPVPRDRADLWSSRQESPIGSEMLMRMSDTPGLVERYILASRLPFLLFPLLTAVLLWWWSRQLYAPSVAVLLAAAFALEPTALGHGAFFKNDLAASFTFLLFWYRAWRFCTHPSAGNRLWLGAALGIALLAKLSLAILIPIGPALVLARGFRLASPARSLAHAAEVSVVAFAILCAAYRSCPPIAYWDGLVSIWQSNSDGGGISLWGLIVDAGHPLYFLAALAVKVPAPLQLLVVCGAALTAIHWRRRSAPDLLWLFPPLLYIALASLSNLQLGVRLILPALPFGLLIAGSAIGWLLHTRARATLLAAMFVWMAIVSARIYPYGLSYFNVWTGGPSHALEYLADSNVDWGQGLPALAEFQQTQGIEKLRLSYFGLDNPWRFFHDEQVEFVPPPWEPSMARGEVLQPEPGVYAISASLLPGFLFHPPYRDYYRFFRERKPLAIVAHSIYVYRVTGPNHRPTPSSRTHRMNPLVLPRHPALQKPETLPALTRIERPQ